MKTTLWILLSFLFYSCNDRCNFPNCKKDIAGWMKCSDAPQSLAIYCKGEAIQFDEGDYCSQAHAEEHNKEEVNWLFD
ncbi:hypothetical protein [Sediminicola luteus]|uniref:Kazal-like domain-containing protein n=1 Tax=Sediminicola luteus TaxID=319238 RepID=A0ABV2TTU9_9FLAO